MKYDRQGAVDYAHLYTEGLGQHRGRHYRGLSCIIDAMLTWANPEYFFYFPNCANFVSQCLHCGGKIPMTDDWHHTRTPAGKHRFHRVLSGMLILLQRTRMLFHIDCWDVSQCWRCAPAHFDYFGDAKSGCPGISPIPVSKDADAAELLRQYPIQIGDLIYLVQAGRIRHCLLITKLTDREIYYSANRYTRYDRELSFALHSPKTERAYIVCLPDSLAAEENKLVRGD